jgi:hypothetical protein
MSFIRKADVKSHLSTRHRTELHLSQPGSLADATGFAGEESGSTDPKMKDSVEGSLNLHTSSRPEPATIVSSKNVQD